MLQAGHMLPIWLKTVVRGWLLPAIHIFSALLAFIVSVGSEMSLYDFCADVSKADKFKDRAMKVFECNEIDEVGDLQWTSASKMENAALQAMMKLPQDLEGEPLWSQGVGAFIQRVFAKEAALREAEAKSTASAPESSMLDQLSLASGSQPKQARVYLNLNLLVNGDYANGKEAMSLSGLDLEQWPKADLVDNMATEIARLKARGVDKPFLYTDVAQFLPGWCPKGNKAEEQESAEEAEQLMGKGFRLMAERLGAPKNIKQRLDVLRWIVAFDRFAIALAATGQLSYGKAMEHKALCQKVALEANEGRRGGLGVVYDEVARKAWETRARSGCAFDIEAVAGKLDDNLLHDAKRVYDAAGKTSAVEAAGKSKGFFGALGIVCYTCGKSGHKSGECTLNTKGASKGAGGYKGAGKFAAASKGKGKALQCHTCGMMGHKSDKCPNAHYYMVDVLMQVSFVGRCVFMNDLLQGQCRH